MIDKSKFADPKIGVMKLKYRYNRYDFTCAELLKDVDKALVLRFAPWVEGQFLIPGVCLIANKNLIGYALPDMSFQPI